MGGPRITCWWRCHCSTCSENSSAPVVSPRIDNRPPCAPKFSFAVLCSAEPATAWCYICRLPGVASNHVSHCWKTSYPTVSQLRRSYIPGSRLEPKIHQRVSMKQPSTSDFRIRQTPGEFCSRRISRVQAHAVSRLGGELNKFGVALHSACQQLPIPINQFINGRCGIVTKPDLRLSGGWFNSSLP